MNLNVRIKDGLEEFIKQIVEEEDYDNYSEYIRDLLRKEKKKYKEKQFNKIKARLEEAINAPREEFTELGSKEEFLADIRKRAKEIRDSRQS